jgi:hypothetical protein
MHEILRPQGKFYSRYAIGVVTYVKRFEEYFQPLVAQLDRIFPGVEKNFVINGFYDQEQQQKYLDRALPFLRGSTARSVTYYQENQSLSRCWNQLILNSTNKKILILNDDLILRPLFRLFLEAQIGRFDTAVINRSWSHFFLTKSIVKKIGWFDERFPGVGQEDGDYVLRLAEYYGIRNSNHNYIHNIYCFGVKNIVAKNPDPGWKRQSQTLGEKYTKANTEFLNSKWQVLERYEPGSIRNEEGKFLKIRAGMGTPNFYPDADLGYN